MWTTENARTNIIPEHATIPISFNFRTSGFKMHLPDKQRKSQFLIQVGHFLTKYVEKIYQKIVLLEK